MFLKGYTVKMKVILCGKDLFEMHCQSLQENQQLKSLHGLKHLTQHFMSEQDFLSRIYGLDYGFLERKNRPTEIILQSAANGIGLNPLQTLCPAVVW